MDLLTIKIFAGVGTKIDPTLCRADRLVGQVLGAVGTLPNIYIEIEITYFLLRRLLGVQTDGDKKAARVRSLLSTYCGFDQFNFLSMYYKIKIKLFCIKIYYRPCLKFSYSYSFPPIANSNWKKFVLQVQRLEKKEALLLNIGSMSTGGVVMQAKSDIAVVRLQLPVCTELGEKVALSRRIDKHWR